MLPAAALAGFAASAGLIIAIGSQNAFVSGMQLATGDAVVLLDGDLQDPPELIAAFYAQWREGNDVVYGRRRTRTARSIGPSLRCCIQGIPASPGPIPLGSLSIRSCIFTAIVLAMWGTSHLSSWVICPSSSCGRSSSATWPACPAALAPIGSRLRERIAVSASPACACQAERTRTARSASSFAVQPRPTQRSESRSRHSGRSSSRRSSGSYARSGEPSTPHR